MSAWFEGQTEISCSIDDVTRAVEDLGVLFVGVVSRMPGLATVELVEHDSDSVIIRTNEGLMTRSNIVRHVDGGHVVIEYDEKYEAGSRVTTATHFRDEFTASGEGVTYRLVMTGVRASGFLGLLYRVFGRSKTGLSFLAAYKGYLESRRA